MLTEFNSFPCILTGSIRNLFTKSFSEPFRTDTVSSSVNEVSLVSVYLQYREKLDRFIAYRKVPNCPVDLARLLTGGDAGPLRTPELL